MLDGYEDESPFFHEHMCLECGIPMGPCAEPDCDAPDGFDLCASCDAKMG